jgi:hypothetical protein
MTKREHASAIPPSALESTAAATPRRAAMAESADTRAKVTAHARWRNYMAGNRGR